MPKLNSIDDIKSIVGSGKGFARSNLFYVEIPSPWQGYKETRRALGFLCTSVTLPSRQLTTVERKIGIETQQVVYGFLNPPVSMTFRILNDQKGRQFFEDWQQSIVYDNTGSETAEDGDYKIAFPDDYAKSSIKIYQLKRGFSVPLFNAEKNYSFGILSGSVGIDLDLEIFAGGATYMWELQQAFPVTLQSETLADGGTTISEINVEFAYKKWKGTIMDETNSGGILGSIGLKTNIPGLDKTFDFDNDTIKKGIKKYF